MDQEQGKCVVLGMPQNVEEVVDGSSYILHDPFLATTLDFIRRCLDQLSKALHVAVCHTYRSLPGKKKTSFFLASFSPWKDVRNSTGTRRVYHDPAVHESGRDIQWLLKNVKFHIEFYAEKLGLDPSQLEHITLFLLDSVRNQMAHQYYLKKLDCDDPGNPWLRKYLLTSDCINAAIDLVTAFSEAEYFRDVCEEIRKIRRNLERMSKVLQEHKLYSERKRREEEKPLDTGKVMEFLEEGTLAHALRLELCKHGSAEDKPLTHLFQTVVIPRINKVHKPTQAENSV